MIPSFVPSNGPLVVRTGMGTVPENHRKTHHIPTTMKDFAGAKPNNGTKTRFGQLSQSSFFARHNPQSTRVRHIKGLLDLPICAVNDGGYMSNPRLTLRRPATHGGEDLSLRWSYPMSGPRTAPTGGRLLPVHSVNYHPNHINASLQKHHVNFQDATKNYRRFPFAMKERADPKFGMIPMTDSWRDELRDLTERAGLGLPKEEPKEQPVKRTSVYSADTGRLIPPPSRAMSRGFSRQKQRDIRGGFMNLTSDQDHEVLVLEMLCQILQTDSMAAVQSWLVSAGNREKDLVLDMIASALTTEETYFNQEQNKDDYYDKREATARPLTTEYGALGAEMHGHTDIPNMMNVQNGYGELDRPIPPSRDQGNGYSRYSYSRDEQRSKLGSASAKQLETIYDDQADHPSLRQSSSKSDVFKVHHSPRSQSKAEVMKIIHPPSPPTQRRSTSKSNQLNSSSPPAASQQYPPGSAAIDQPKVRYTTSALDIRDEDLKRHTLASILKEDRLSAKSARGEKGQRT
ncbi:uncharacterized protein [Amphiura filiformis]|uniref:uncharacterized protein isoform X1 n=1 Tax=Amphiura filiformis TaxID=82378 RepID=UPI003B2130DF